MYRRLFASIVVAAVLSAESAAPAASTDQTRWFLSATSYGSVTTYKPMGKADFIGAMSWTKMPCPGWNGQGPHPVMFATFWQLAKYDRTHHIALAGATTDQCSTALFVASPPGFAVPNANLSRYSTARGLHIGSTTADVIATYGKPLVPIASCARRCVLGYSATTSGHAVTTGHPLISLPEHVTVVMTAGRLSAITIFVELGGLF